MFHNKQLRNYSLSTSGVSETIIGRHSVINWTKLKLFLLYCCLLIKKHPKQLNLSVMLLMLLMLWIAKSKERKKILFQHPIDKPQSVIDISAKVNLKQFCTKSSKSFAYRMSFTRTLDHIKWNIDEVLFLNLSARHHRERALFGYMNAIWLCNKTSSKDSNFLCSTGTFSYKDFKFCVVINMKCFELSWIC